MLQTKATPEKLVQQLANHVEFSRLEASRRLDRSQRAKLGQFFTPWPTAQLMASMFAAAEPDIRLLDAGAGVGSLSAALVAELCTREQSPTCIHITAFEVDLRLEEYLRETLGLCKEVCMAAGVQFEYISRQEDFVASGVEMLECSLFSPPVDTFNYAILNPPYHKIRISSAERLQLRRAGIETSNIYTGFLSLVIRLLEPEGELTAITPRSFCNGVYFRNFRKWLLKNMSLRRVHVFERRDHAFKDDEVLQENIIFHAYRSEAAPDSIEITSSVTPKGGQATRRLAPWNEVVEPADTESFIRLEPSQTGQLVAKQVNHLRSRLSDLGLSVSTGPVVDFRAKHLLCYRGAPNSVPLIYPSHLQNGLVRWPNMKIKKPDAVDAGLDRLDLLLPSDVYVLVKRFSAKEERRRLVAAVFCPEHIGGPSVAFENHVNYYHFQNQGLPLVLARGLAAYLNSTVLDLYFRQFNGHTQVNAADLRNIPYPTRQQLDGLGAKIGAVFPSQEELDRLVNEELFLGV